MPGPADHYSDSLPQSDDELRTLVSAILSGDCSEQSYLRQVAALCRSKPQSAGALLACLDRYHRLGRMPTQQYQMLKTYIARTLSAVERDRTRDQSTKVIEPRAPQQTFEDRTCILPVPATPVAPPAPAAPMLEPLSLPPMASLPASAPTSPPAIASGDAAPAIAVGSVLRGRYELQHILGQGGMATVYQALDRYRLSLGLQECLVALKVVRTTGWGAAGSRALGWEFHNAQRLSHPNVVNVYEIDRDGETTFYTMELVSGARLGQVLQRLSGATLPRPTALALIREIGAAIQHAHSRGVVHGDLKPNNIMVTQDGQVRVMDFGGLLLSVREPYLGDADASEDYRPATPAYASCEQLERQRADPRDDIYAMACIAYLLLAGKHPFDHLSAIEARARGLRPSRPPRVSFNQWRALRRGLAWSREQRTMSIDTWLSQLGLESAAPLLPPLSELTSGAAAPRTWRRAAALGLPLLTLGVAAVALLWQSHSAAVDDPTRGALSAVASTLRNAWQEVQHLYHDTRPPLAQGEQLESSVPADAEPKAAGAPTSLLAAPGAPLSARPAAPAQSAPHVAFAAERYDVSATDPAARIVVRRVGSTQGDLSFVWWTEAATAEPNVDYASLGRRTEHMASGQDKMTVYVPIIYNPLRRQSTQFRVAIGESGNRVDAQSTAHGARATVTIERGG